MGLPFAFAGQFAPEMMMEAAALYRQLFKPSATLKQPYLMIGLPVLAPEQIAKLDAASDTPPTYPYWHQRGFAERNPPPV